MLTTQFGPLVCRLVDRLPAAHKPQLGVVLCHGYGAAGIDLVPLAEALLEDAHLAGGVRFVLPEAPLPAAGMGGPARSWWPVDLAGIQQAMLLGQLEAFLEDEPAGMGKVRRMLHACIDAFCLQSGLGYGQLVLGGVSQGGLLAADLSLRLDEAARGLVILSGIVMCQAAWRKRVERRSGMPVFQAHGRGDPILPEELAGKLRDLLGEGGLAVNYVCFEGGHEIPAVIVSGLRGFLLRNFSR